MHDTHTTSSNELNQSPTIVYFVRHGITEWNAQHRFQGHEDVPLSEAGREQARAVADWLVKQTLTFSAVYSSDLARARQTAEAIAARLHLEPVYCDSLREIHVGEWQGLSVTEVNERYPGELDRWHREIDTFALPGGGENTTLVQERTYRCLQELLARHKGQAFVVVSHGMALSALIAAVHGWDLAETFQTNRARLGNTGVTAVEIDPATGETRSLFMNSSEHLARPTGMAPAYDQSV